MSDKKKREFDESQKAAINAIKNSVVSAGAGSGKTTVLSERFTKLVNENHFKPEEILTLTFTKKATVEMSSRIYKVLKESAPEAAKDFYKANIKTIDSYCASVAKMGSRYYGISPDFSVDADAVLQKANEIALPFLLNHKDERVIQNLIGTKNYDEIADEMFVKPICYNSTIAEPIDFEKTISLQKEEIKRVWNERCKKILNGIDSLHSAYEAYDGNKNTKFLVSISEFLETEIPEIPEITDKMLDNSDSSLCENFKDSFSLLYKERLSANDEIKDCVRNLRDTITKLDEIIAFVQTYKNLLEIIPYFKEFQDKINDFKRSSAILTFNDVSSLACAILRDYPEIRQIEKEKYKAIMIDEFQDNNQAQRDLLFMLAENLERHEKGVPSVDELCKDKLFFVGDEKQSIYLFRGADVSVFRALSSDFKDGNLSMTTNYRSNPALIASFNTIFGGFDYPPKNQDALSVNVPAVFFTEKDEANLSRDGENVPSYEAVYHKVTLPKNKEESIDSKTYAPHIHFALYDNKREVSDKTLLTDEEAEAEWVARKIKSLATEGENGKVYKYNEIALLLRNTTNQNLFERSFLNHGIPYNTETVKGFFSDGPANDVFSFLRICLYPNDTMSYAEVLKSPLVNLSFEEASAVLLSEKLPFQLKDESVLCKESLARYNHAKAFFEDFMQSLPLLEIPEIITKFWYESGYRYEIMWNQTVEMYSKIYDMIYSLAQKAQNDNQSLAAFVDSVRDLKDDSQKLDDMDIPMEKVSGVNIMTIHKSKGLEFPVVFVANTHKKGFGDRNATPVYYDSKFGISINATSKTNYFYNLMKAEKDKKDNAELRRVVYVALTRAIDELYITNGKYSASKAPDDYLAINGGNVDTVFKILEPFFNYYTQDETDEKPFTFEEIEPCSRFENEASEKRKNTFSEKENLFSKIEQNEYYEKAALVKKDKVDSKYISPSHFDDETDNEVIEKSSKVIERDNKMIEESRKVIEALEITNETNIPYPEINEIVEKTNGEFSFNNFGTIAHAFMESFVNGSKVEYSEKEIVAIKDREKDVKTIEKICREMQEHFRDSELGKAAIDAKKNRFCKTEYSFRSKVDSENPNEEKIVKGTIDLVFQNDDKTYTIVDYKTNQTIEPEIYKTQLGFYRNAVSQMLGIAPETIKCYLYYLRFGEEIQIDN